MHVLPMIDEYAITTELWAQLCCVLSSVLESMRSFSAWRAVLPLLVKEWIASIISSGKGVYEHEVDCVSLFISEELHKTSRH